MGGIPLRALWGERRFDDDEDVPAGLLDEDDAVASLYGGGASVGIDDDMMGIVLRVEDMEAGLENKLREDEVSQ